MTSSLLHILGYPAKALTTTAAEIISGNLLDLCYQDITVDMASIPDETLLELKPIISKLCKIEGKRSKVTQLVSWLGFPFLKPILKALGGNEAVKEASIEFTELRSAIDTIKVECCRSRVASCHFT